MPKKVFLSAKSIKQILYFSAEVVLPMKQYSDQKQCFGTLSIL